MNDIADKERFHNACELVRNGGRLKKGIGTKNESSVHAVLKNYFEQRQDAQEITIGKYTADIVGEDGIIEVQTSHFLALAEKLEAFLPAAHVTVVYPIYINKRIVYLNEDGSEKRARMSPLKGSLFNIFPEIFPIARFLTNNNLSFRLMIMDCDEYRISPLAIGKTKNKNNKHSVFDRFPTRLIDEITISAPEEWVKLIPCLREKDFTVTDAAAAAHTARKNAAAALAVLYRGGVLERTGKKGRAFCYSFYRDNVPEN